MACGLTLSPLVQVNKRGERESEREKEMIERERCERKITPVLFAAVIDCGALESPVHGQVKAQETKFHSVATYSCNMGYVLTGDEIRICIETGHWSGSAPACTSR